MSDDRPSHLEIYMFGKWHIWHGPSADAAWTALFLFLFFSGFLAGLILGISI